MVGMVIQPHSKGLYTHYKAYQSQDNTVDGRNPANHLGLVVYPIICKVYRCQVVQDFFHQQYLGQITITTRYPVMLKILGFQIAPHFVGKYIIPGESLNESSYLDVPLEVRING